MIVLPLGTGNAFTKKYFHTNLLIKLNKFNLLLDAGTTLRYSLAKTKTNINSIDGIFITHFHHDHAGGLGELLTSAFWQFNNNVHSPHKPVLFVRPAQLEEMDHILSPSLNNQGFIWQDYCHVVAVENGIYDGETYTIEIIPTDHLHCQGLKSCGLKITDKKSKENIIISGDIKNLKESRLLSYVDENTRAIFQDVHFGENTTHATYEEVLEYYPRDYLHKIYGIHYGDETASENAYKIKLAQQGVPLAFSLPE